MSLVQKLWLIGGAAAAVLFYIFIDLDPAKPEVTKMAAVALLMAAWWITEAIPLAATSLVPLILFPLWGILDGGKTAEAYINSVIFLFIGGFMLAIAMENWGLHRRIALKIITFFGGSPNSIIYGFMLSAAFLSMWISNTATAVMMLPIGLAIINKMENEFGKERTLNFAITLMLGIAYSCTLGGISTLIGTPPNLVLVRILHIIFPEAPQISFGSWMIMCMPIAFVMLIIAALVITRVFYKFDKNLIIDPNFIRDEYKKLGRISFEEKTVGIIFSLTALLWIFRADLNIGFLMIPGWQNIFSNPDFLNDGVVAISMAFTLFLIPSKNSREQKTILDVKVFNKIPWGIILLFGGGFALAEGFTSSGLSEYIGANLGAMHKISPLIIIIVVAFTINFLTELTSNTATAQMILPIAASVSIAIGLNPLLLMITVALSSSMAFMLPVATPPNTIVFSYDRLKIIHMVKSGFLLNISSVILVVLLVYLIGSMLFDLNTFPAWAK
jgi:sodium-dependent dicarboxylate transporter 2/3/5